MIREHSDFYNYVEDDFQHYQNICKSKQMPWLGEIKGEVVHSFLDYKNRWSDSYKNKFHSRLQLLTEWAKWHTGDVTFLTITTRQKTIDGKPLLIPEQIDLLRNGWQKLRKVILKRYPDIDFLASMDFHKTGFGHFHIVFFQRIDYHFQSILKQKWSLDYCLGHPISALKFDVHGSGKINNVVLYLFKHAGKVYRNRMLPGWKRFHACVYYMENSREYRGVRLFSMSKRIKTVMKIQTEETVETILVRTHNNKQVYTNSQGFRDNMELVRQSMTMPKGIGDVWYFEQLKKKQPIKKYLEMWDDLSFD